jgi:Family of unknown function (DUF6152)
MNGGGRVKSRRAARFVSAVGLFLISIPLLAHHGGSEYDMTKVVSLQATVTDFQFVNPHTLINFTVKDDSGEIIEWQGELPSPNLLLRRGWNRNILKPGEQVTIIGNPAKNGKNGMQVKRLVFPDGHELPGTILPPDSSK